jgi:hypothetical protein
VRVVPVFIIEIANAADIQCFRESGKPGYPVKLGGSREVYAAFREESRT